ncbi:MAG: HAAS signaling domain-containing protein [Armatimonadota bacterium]
MTFLDEVRKKLDLPPAEKEQVMRELESHYHEIEDEAVDSGMNECEAATEAARRLGDPSDIAQRMQTVHCRATWKTAILTALPFLMFVFIATVSFMPVLINNRSLEYLYPLSTIPVIAILLIGSARELKANRRPLWLATWLPAGIMILSAIVHIVTRGIVLNIYTSNNMMPVIAKTLIHFAMRNSIQILILGLLALWVYRRSRKWMLIITGVIIAGLSLHIVFALTYYNNNPHYIMSLPEITREFFSVVIVTFLAVKLFIRHPYGDVARTSLMLYTLLLPGLTMTIDGDINLIYWMTMLSLIISGLVVLAYSRIPQHMIKQWILAAVIIIQGFMGVMATSSLSSLESYNESMIATILNLTFIIFVPEIIDRYYKKRNPEFAH